jgi:hypothetical protein
VEHEKITTTHLVDKIRLIPEVVAAIGFRMASPPGVGDSLPPNTPILRHALILGTIAEQNEGQ